MDKLEELMNINQFIGNKLIAYLEKRLELSNIEYQKIYLGIMVVVMNLSKLIFISIIAFFLGILKEVLTLFVIFASLRINAAGIHSKSNFTCTIISLTVYIGSAYISINYLSNIWLNAVIYVLFTLLLWRYAPADTEKRPILGRDTRRECKIRTIITTIVLGGINLIFLDEKIFNLTLCAIVVQAISVLPCTYKIFNESYNNYEKYEKR